EQMNRKYCLYKTSGGLNALLLSPGLWAAGYENGQPLCVRRALKNNSIKACADRRQVFISDLTKILSYD
ncbi:MAG: hypothetical protein ABI687_11850, partial [Flavitalea sp.]